MLAIALSLLFGLVALAAIVEIRSASLKGWQRGRAIHAELARGRRRAAPTRVAEPRLWRVPLRAAA